MQWCRTYPYVSFFGRFHVEIYVHINIVVKNYRVLYFITQKRTQKISLVRKFCHSSTSDGRLPWRAWLKWVFIAEWRAIYFHDHPSTLKIKVKLHGFFGASPVYLDIWHLTTLVATPEIPDSCWSASSKEFRPVGSRVFRSNHMLTDLDITLEKNMMMMVELHKYLSDIYIYI